MKETLLSKPRIVYLASCLDKKKGEIPLFVTNTINDAVTKHIERIRRKGSDLKDFKEKINAPNRYGFILGGEFLLVKKVSFYKPGNIFCVLSSETNGIETPYSYHKDEADAVAFLQQWLDIESITTKADGSRIVDGVTDSKIGTEKLTSRYIIRIFDI